MDKDFQTTQNQHVITSFSILASDCALMICLEPSVQRGHGPVPTDHAINALSYKLVCKITLDHNVT